MRRTDTSTVLGRALMWPDAPQELLAAEDPPVVFQKESHETKLRGCQIDDLTVHENAVRDVVEENRTDPHGGVAGHRARTASCTS